MEPQEAAVREAAPDVDLTNVGLIEFLGVGAGAEILRQYNIPNRYLGDLANELGEAIYAWIEAGCPGVSEVQG